MQVFRESSGTVEQFHRALCNVDIFVVFRLSVLLFVFAKPFFSTRPCLMEQLEDEVAMVTQRVTLIGLGSLHCVTMEAIASCFLSRKAD